MNSIIYPNVHLGKNIIIEDFCIIGKPQKGKVPVKDVYIGDNAIIRSHTIIYEGNSIGKDFQSGHHVVIREDNTIGDNVSIGTLSCIEHHIIIETDVRIHSQVFIPEFSILKKGSWIGPNVVLTNAKYPKGKNVKNNLKGPIINSFAKIGANSTLLPGVNIGKNSLIGSGSLVSSDIPEDSVAFGHPAKVRDSIKNISEYEELGE